MTASATRAVRLAALGAGRLLLAAARARAGVILTERAALERAFPGQTPERRILYLTEQQAVSVQKAAPGTFLIGRQLWN